MYEQRGITTEAKVYKSLIMVEMKIVVKKDNMLSINESKGLSKPGEEPVTLKTFMLPWYRWQKTYETNLSVYQQVNVYTEEVVYKPHPEYLLLSSATNMDSLGRQYATWEKSCIE